jgi:hypothetical protein
MKLLTIAPIAVTVELDATDCLILADALAASIHYDACPEYSLVNALRAALEGFAVLAATDTLRDNQTPEAGMLEDTRQVWGAFDVSGRGKPRITRRPE